MFALRLNQPRSSNNDLKTQNFTKDMQSQLSIIKHQNYLIKLKYVCLLIIQKSGMSVV